MNQNKELSNDPRMEDCYAFVHNVLGTSEWVPLYANQHIPEPTGELFLISALVPEDLEEDILSGHDWEINVSSFRPDYTIYYGHGIKNVQYHRFGRNDSIEPIIVQHHFHGLKEAYFDISEEFRHLYNLYYDVHEKTYIAILDDGNEEDVVRTSKDRVVISAKYLKEFLAIKQCILVLYFNIDRYSPGNLSNSGELPQDEIRKSGSINCSISIRDWDWRRDGSYIYSRLLGKKVIRGLREFDPEKLFSRFHKQR